MSTIKMGCDDYCSVYLTVVVNRWFYDVETLEKKVRDYYCELNGEPEQLKINMFCSRIAFEKGICQRKVEFL